MNCVVALTLFRKPTKEMSISRRARFLAADNFDGHTKIFTYVVSRGNLALPRQSFVHRLMFH